VTALLAVAYLPSPWRSVADRFFDVGLRPLLAAIAALVVVWTATVILKARAVRRLPSVGQEEPLLSPARLATGQPEVKVVILAGVERGCGASTLTFNLAVSLAAQGAKSGADDVRRPRPACVLTEGPLSAALGLNPEQLEEHLGQRPYRVAPEVVNLAVRHPSGCALFCLRRDDRDSRALGLLLGELGRRFDAVLVDAALPERDLGHLAAEMSDFLLLVAQPTGSSVNAAGRWIERVWGMGLEPRTGLILNRVPAWPPPPLELRLAFLHHSELPHQQQVPALDRRGLPWSQDAGLAAARQLSAIARGLFPTLMPEGRSAHAA
jgi:hypothetical protein